LMKIWFKFEEISRNNLIRRACNAFIFLATVLTVKCTKVKYTAPTLPTIFHSLSGSVP
jgi:hypothetical protein